jgi:hypothetical protein
MMKSKCMVVVEGDSVAWTGRASCEGTVRVAGADGCWKGQEGR